MSETVPPEPSPEEARKRRNSLIAEYIPTIVYLVTYFSLRQMPEHKDMALVYATATMIPFSLGVLAYIWFTQRRISALNVFSLTILCILTPIDYHLKDSHLIQLRQTIWGLVMGTVTIGGALYGKYLFKALMGPLIDLTDQEWRLYSFVFGGLFLGLAGMNEVTRRFLSQENWVLWDTFGEMIVAGLVGGILGFVIDRKRTAAEKALAETQRSDT
jgi:intracellular septation protein A